MRPARQHKCNRSAIGAATSTRTAVGHSAVGATTARAHATEGLPSQLAGEFHAVKDEVDRCTLQAGDFANLVPRADTLRDCILDSFRRLTANRRFFSAAKESHGNSSFQCLVSILIWFVVGTCDLAVLPKPRGIYEVLQEHLQPLENDHGQCPGDENLRDQTEDCPFQADFPALRCQRSHAWRVGQQEDHVRPHCG